MLHPRTRLGRASMPETMELPRLPRPGEIEARQAALDKLVNKITPEKARMMHMLAELGLGAPLYFRYDVVRSTPGSRCQQTLK